MFCRKWVVRGLVALVLACCLGAGVVYQQWTNPTAVRQQVVEMLEKQFPGATVTLDGARLRLLGGVVLTELRLLRRPTGPGEGDQADIIYIPQATVYHDKERLLEGQFAVRRIEMFRPRVRIVRNRDGKWNVEGLTGQADASSPLPTIVIQQGTLVVEDRFAGPAIWVVHDLNLTLVNDASNCLTFSGTGQSENLGAMEVHGNWNRATDATTVSFATTGLAITKDLVQYVASQCPIHKERLAGLQMEGRADITAQVEYQPSASPSHKHDIHCLLRQTCIDHPDLPVPLHNLSAELRSTDGNLVLEKLKTAAGSGKIECKGWVDLADAEKNYGVELTAFYVPFTEDLVKRLPDAAAGIKRLYGRYNPVGNATVHYVEQMQNGTLVRKDCSLDPDKVSICFASFPYPIDRLTGLIEHDFLRNTSKFNAVGYTGAQPITLKGTWEGTSADLECKADIEISGQNVPLDYKLLAALNKKNRDLAESFHPTGQGDFHCTIRRVPGSLDLLNTFEVHFVDCCVKWDKFPYPLEHVDGDLIIYPCKHGEEPQFEFKNFHGTHNGGAVFVTGQTVRHVENKSEGKLVVNIAGQDLCLDKDLHEALAGSPYPGMKKAWDSFKPAGRFCFQAKVEQAGDQRSCDMDIGVELAGCAIKPSFLPYALDDVACQFRFHKNRVDVNSFTARHNGTQLSLSKATVDLIPRGDNNDVYAVLDDLRVNPVLIDEDLLEALPPNLGKTLKAVHLEKQTLAVQAKKVVLLQGGEDGKKSDIYWDGQVWLHDAELSAGIDFKSVNGTLACSGRYNGTIVGLSGNLCLDQATILHQPFHDVYCHFMVDGKAPDVAVFNLRAPLFGGDISGVGRLEFASTPHYQMDLTASQIDLAQFGRHNLGANHQLAGIAAAQLHLQGQGASVPGDSAADHLDGKGSIDVPYSSTTHLLNLPLLLDLLKFLGLRLPDQTAFEEAHAAFTIRGKRASITKLELQGNAVSLYGKGDVNLDGTDLKLDMYPTFWGRAEQVLPSVVKSVPSAISKQLLKIEVHGTVGGKDGDLQFTKRPVPGLMDPLMELGNRMMGKGGEGGR